MLDDLTIQFDAEGMSDGYTAMVRDAINRIVSEYFPYARSMPTLQKCFHAELPILIHRDINQPKEQLAFTLIMKQRPRAPRFFFEMLVNWLVPGKKFSASFYCEVDFPVPDLSKKTYTLCEIVLRVESPRDWVEIKKHLPMLSSQICLGVTSGYYARSVIEFKGIENDAKILSVQEDIAEILKKHSNVFDDRLVTEMQYVLLGCSEEFKNHRLSRHLTRVVAYNTLFRNRIDERVRIAPDQRHILAKVVPVKVSGKKVFAIVLGVSFFEEKEILEQGHVMNAVQTIIPELKAVEGAFMKSRRTGEKLGTIYLEVESDSLVSRDQIVELQKKLPDELTDRFEQQMHQIFMPRNDEEVMRNMLTLSGQIRFSSDIPHMIITFDEQTSSHLFFTIIYVRVLKNNSQTIEELFHQSETSLEYIPDFTKVVGRTRTRNKEASVFRVKIEKSIFLRDNHAIDLYKARQEVISELETTLGQFRDYNGGMLTKQNEMLEDVRALLADIGVSNNFLLENFFYAITPAVMRSVIGGVVLKNFFLMFLDALEIEDGSLDIQRDDYFVYVMMRVSSGAQKGAIDEQLAPLGIPQRELATVQLEASDRECLGYLYCNTDAAAQEKFIQTITQLIEQVQ